MSLVTPRDPGSARRTDVRRASRGAIREATLMTEEIRIDAAVASSPGPRRDTNEDSHSAIDGRSTLFVVADGVGGGAMASRASRELVARLHRALDGLLADECAVREALFDADRSIAQTISCHTDASGAATVALCAGIGPWLSEWLVAWVGDCRVYQLRAQHDAPIELLTVDDTYRHLDEAPPPGGSVDDPARMVGNGAVGTPNVRRVGLACGDLLVLCSDGVHKHASDHDVGRMMRSPMPLARRCARLIELARANGGTDDATALAVRRGERHRPQGTKR